MNEFVLDKIARASPGQDLRRHHWRVSEIYDLLERGILDEDDRFEVLEGEIVPMASKGRRHELVRSELSFVWSRSCDATRKVSSETPLRLSDDSEPEPDIIVFPAHLFAPDVGPADVLLVVEVADSSLTQDRIRKARLYARAGVCEYWVIDARTLTTTVYREPGADGYQSETDVGPDAELKPAEAPELAITLRGLGI